MDAAAPRPASAPTGAAPPLSGKTAPPWQVLSSLLQELPGLVSDRVHLLSLELKRASRSFARLVVLVLAAAILLSTAWLALWGAFAAALVAAGIGWGWAFLVVLLINLGAAAWALLQAKKLAPLLGMPATLRHLTLARGVTPDGDADSVPPVTTQATAPPASVPPSTAPAHG